MRPPQALRSRPESMDSFDVESLHGPLFLGYLFNTTLLGILMTQAYLYYTTYKRDNLWTKTAVINSDFFSFRY
ncbi:hypothetical protein BJ912DRAFT_139137 [Pholiota molesta]|nr:hypothetical protein BJ912DRAFT_139137 [Pholiota molesta]